MIMKNRFISYLIIILLFLSCSKEVVPEILNPQTSNLLSPANNETCLDGVSINDSQSDVNFSWTTTQNTVSYDVIVTNLTTQSQQTFSSNLNQTTISLTKAEPYSWKVKSIGEVGSTPAISEQWKFYLAGDAIVNYAPFPAELLSPRSGANVTPGVNNLITLIWTSTDVDGDLDRFEVYLDQTDASILVESINYQADETSIEVEVENDSTYYWKVISIDASGNQSISGVYAFRTN